MKQSMYSIYDKVACVFNKPFAELNNGTAIRAFIDSAEKQPHIKDYELYKLCEFDDNNGEVISTSPIKIFSGLDYLNTRSNTEDLPEVLKNQAT